MLSPSRADTGMKTCASTPMLVRNARYSLETCVEYVLRVIDQVHLVDDDDDLSDADQAQQVSVTPRLLLHAF